MIGTDAVLALIPARGGSKRLPRKNVLDFCGKPLLAWSVEAGLGSAYVDWVCVSTEDDEIAETALRWGAEVPFRRPTELSTDEASSADVALHAIRYYETVLNRKVDILVLLQPTSPLRTASDIDNALEMLAGKGADNVVSVCPVDHSPLWCNTLPADCSMKGFIRDEVKKKRSQDLPQYYRINGAIYVIRTSSFHLTHDFLLEDKAYAHIMPLEHSIDIDTKLDHLLATTIFDASK